jgi:hypothetical protein
MTLSLPGLEKLIADGLVGGAMSNPDANASQFGRSYISLSDHCREELRRVQETVTPLQR